jgi:hypothetical protein
MPTTVAILRRLIISKSRPFHSGRIPTSTNSLVARSFWHPVAQPRFVQSSHARKTLSSNILLVSANALDTNVLRGFATTTKKRTTAKKKTTIKKKVTKRAKKPKKKVRKVAKKPKKPTRPKILDIPPARALNGYNVFIQSQLKTVTGAGAANRLTDAVAQWRALSDSEKQVRSASQ